MSFRRAISIIALILLSACELATTSDRTGEERQAPAAPILATADAHDPHSYARPHEARVRHLALDLTVDFEARRIGGTAILDIARTRNAQTIVLDSKGLELLAVADQEGEPLRWAVGTSDPDLGAPLTISLAPSTRRLIIRYRSAPDASALQWLTPQQTAGKRQPFLFSQGQPIENRSWIPTQDSPGIRQSWEATIRVPDPLTAVMSATRSAEPMTEGGMRIFHYRMDHPVAPYLIAIGVGELDFRDLGPRSGVWAEPATLAAATKEFADTEQMIAAAERLFGPYRWGRYDMLVLPPSFPFGGMENPNLTFLTPSIIAGDQSLVSVVAHELAHSWSGNLATNATWSDFWLNEGITTYAERRIVEELFGPVTAAQQIALGTASLNEEIARLGGSKAPDTRLHLDLAGRHPDSGLTEIAYEKGAAFLRRIEASVGRDRFDAFLRSWFNRHAFKPVTTAMFLSEVRQHLIAGNQRLERELKLDDWVYRPGLPGNSVPPDPKVFAAVDSAASSFAARGSLDASAWRRWNTAEKLRFLDKLPRRLAQARLAQLDRTLSLSDATNSEIRFAWLELAVANRFDPAIPSLESFLTSIGRRKFVRPLILALAKDEKWGRPIAARIYRQARPLYHPIVTRELDSLHLEKQQVTPSS